MDAEFKHVVACSEDKQLRVWQLDDLKLLSQRYAFLGIDPYVIYLLCESRELPKKPTEVRLSNDGLTILVSDKFGDIFRYESPMLVLMFTDVW